MPYLGSYFLFNITADPTETTNLAASQPAALASLLAFLAAYKKTAVPDLSWRWGFKDPTWLDDGGCQGPFAGSQFCSYGHERGCFVRGVGLTTQGADVGVVGGTSSPEACQAACAANAACHYFVFVEAAAAAAAVAAAAEEEEGNGQGQGGDDECHLKAARGTPYACANCSYGPSQCP